MVKTVILGVLVVVASILHTTTAIRNCKKPGADYVTEQELTDYCLATRSAHYMNYPEDDVTYDDLKMYLTRDAHYATHSRVTDVYVHNITQPGCVELEEGFCNISTPCTLTSTYFFVALQNLCVLKDNYDEMGGKVFQIPAQMTLKSDCPFNVSIGQKLVVPLSYSLLPVEKCDLWKQGLPETDTLCVKQTRLLNSTPELLKQIPRFCGYGTPKSPGWRDQSQCPSVPQEGPCDSSISLTATTLTGIATLLSMLTAIILSKEW